MSILRSPVQFRIVALSVLALVASRGGSLQAQSASPPATPPGHWGPVSINLEDVPYPYPVQFLERTLYGQRLRIAYMDVAATGQPNGRAARLPQMETKTLVIGGAEDGPNFPERARTVAEAFPNAELVLIPDVGHNPHLEAPEIFNRELIRFLSSDPDTPAAKSR